MIEAVASSSGSHGGRLLVGGREQLRVLDAVEHHKMLHVDRSKILGQLRVDQQHLGARVTDDVLDLRRGETEIDRHQHSPERAHPKQRDHEARRVRAHDRHARAVRHAKPVERACHPTTPTPELRMRDLAQRRWPPRLVDHGHTVAVQSSTLQEIDQRQRHAHALATLLSHRARGLGTIMTRRGHRGWAANP